MNDDAFENIQQSVETSNAQTIGLVEKLFTVTQPGAVFGEPVTANNTTVITASEVWVGMGYGFGAGGGAPFMETEIDLSDEEFVEDVEDDGFGVGGGGGGGGFSAGRPVAAVIIGPDGVEVEPIVDATKIALAFFTMLGAMLIMLGRMMRTTKDLG